MPSGSCEAAHPKSSSETVVPPTELKKPDEFAQQTLRDMKATTWTPRVNAHVPKCNASEPSVPTQPVTHGLNVAQMAQELAAMGWVCTQPPQPAEGAPKAVEAAKAAPPPPMQAPKAAPPKAVETSPPPKAVVEAPKAVAPASHVLETPPPSKAVVETPKAVAPASHVLQTPPPSKAAVDAPKAVAPAPPKAAPDAVVQPPPPKHMSPPPMDCNAPMAPPPPPMQVKQEPLSKAALQAHAHADAQKEQDKQYTRRAAANLIQRLRENPARTAAFPALAQMINNEAKKSELISLLVTNDGAFDKVGLHLQAYEDAFDGETNRKKALRWSKKEVEDHYGADAEKIMKYKTETGMVEDDENNPGGVLYLISRKEDEAEKGWKKGNLALFSMGHLHNMNLIYFFQARGFPMFHECLMIHDAFFINHAAGPWPAPITSYVRVFHLYIYDMGSCANTTTQL